MLEIICAMFVLYHLTIQIKKIKSNNSVCPCPHLPTPTMLPFACSVFAFSSEHSPEGVILHWEIYRIVFYFNVSLQLNNE